ncbi:hypothetical protein ACFVWN_00925 [Nocardiopsis flavescens]|uniref:hypothetical protein n=1 Tax=Nocardiopsis flavescens TaxID=758803 RepID=UPI00365BFC74
MAAPSNAPLTAGTEIAPYQIEPGMRIAVTLRNESRLALTASRRMKEHRGATWSIAGYRIGDGKHWRLDGDDIDRILSLG